MHDMFVLSPALGGIPLWHGLAVCAECAIKHQANKQNPPSYYSSLR